MHPGPAGRGACPGSRSPSRQSHFFIPEIGRPLQRDVCQALAAMPVSERRPNKIGFGPCPWTLSTSSITCRWSTAASENISRTLGHGIFGANVVRPLSQHRDNSHPTIPILRWCISPHLHYSGIGVRGLDRRPLMDVSDFQRVEAVSNTVIARALSGLDRQA
jgi:hypothetical protein